MLRPMLSYYGAKWRAAPRYPAPRHNLIVEPFAGSAGYALRHHEHDVVLIDRDDRVCRAWSYLINATPADIMALPLLDAHATVWDHDLSPGARAFMGFWLRPGSTGGGRRLTAWARANPEGAGASWLPFQPLYAHAFTAGAPGPRLHTEAVWTNA